MDLQCARCVVGATDGGTELPSRSVSPSPLEITLLLVKTGGSGRRRVLKSLSNTANLRIVCMSETENWAAPYVSEWLIDPMTDHVRGLAHVREYIATHNVHFDGVLSYDEYGVELAAHLASALGLPGILPANIDVIRNKLALRQLCLARGVPSPAVLRVNGDGVFVRDVAHLTELLEAAELSFPLVVKPTHGAGKYSVRRVDSVSALFTAIVAFRDNIDAFIERWVLPRDHAEGLFVESYLEGGPEVDVDFVASRGQLVFCSINENRAPVGPCFAEAGGHCPPTFGEAQRAGIIELTKDLIGLFGNDLSGCFHFEAKCTGQGPVPLELNPRIGGAETFSMITAVYKVDLARAALHVALGHALQPEDFVVCHQCPVVYSSSVNFCPDWRGTGLLRKQHVEDYVQADPTFVDMELYYSIDSVVVLPPDGSANMGWLVARGNTPEEAESALQRLVAGVSFSFEKLPEASVAAS